MQPKPKKSLGQNFLIDRNIRAKICAAAGVTISDTVLEIGAGRGELTELLAEKAKKVYALEIDHVLVALLQEKFQHAKNVEVIHADFLKFDIRTLVAKARKKLKVLGNIPYYISSPIIEHLLRHRNCIGTILLTVQKEFAQRAVSAPGSKTYGSFSCFVQYYAEPKILFSISRHCFYPAPKVDSACMQLIVKKKVLLSPQKEKKLFSVIRAAFGKRRKTLRNSLEGVVPQEALERFFASSGTDRNTRPELLSLANFTALVNA